MRGNDGHQCLTELIIAIWKMFSFSFSFQWCFFFLQLRLQGNGRPRATLCMLRIVVFFFHGSKSNERTKFSELGPRRYVNDFSFRFQWVFFSIRLTRKWKTTGHIMQAVIFGCFLSWKYRLNQSKTNDQWENFY